jgi:hypothetical protein
MLDKLPRWPRSSYPDHTKKKFDYSKDANLTAYFNTAKELGVDIRKINSDTLEDAQIDDLIFKISQSNSFHVATVYSDLLWDAYNSYDKILQSINTRLTIEKKSNQEKLTLAIRYLRIDSGLNRRPIEGKHYNEIMSDANFFKDLATRANNILKQFA